MKKKIFLFVFSAMLFSLTPKNSSAQQEGFLGEVKMFAGNFAPRGWAICAGQILSISSNSALFSILGTMYGGDGRTSFALPDLRGRTPVGAGNGPGLSDIRIGAKQGAENVTLTTLGMPSHSHYVANISEVEIKTSPGNANSKDEAIKVLSLNTSSGSEKVPTHNTGSGQSISIKPPTLGMNYIICIAGTFPSRS